VCLLPLLGYAIFLCESIFAPPNPLWAFALLLWSVATTLLAFKLSQESAGRLWDTIDRYANHLVIGLIITISVVFVTISILQTHYFAISAHAEDTAYYSQVLWNTLQGNFLSGNVQQERLYHPSVSNDLALHVSPVLLGFLPIYALFPNALTLLIIKDVAIAAAAWPLFLLARERMGGTAGAAAAILYFANPAVIAQGFEAFYLLHLAPLTFFYCLRAFAREEFHRFAWWIGIALTIREDIAIALTGFGIWALVGRRQWRWVVLGFGIPVLWWGLTTLLIQPIFGRWGNSAFDTALAGGQTSPIGIYQSLLGSPAWIVAALREGGLDYLYRMLRPVAFLGVLGWEGALAVPSLAANLFLGRVFYSGNDPISRFALLPSCALIGATVLVVWRLSRQQPWDRRAFVVIMFLLLPSVSLLDGAKDAVQTRIDSHTVRNNAPALWEAIAQIPDTASVAAPNYALPALSNRQKLFYLTYLDMYPQAQPDYLLIDRDIDRVTTNPDLRAKYVVLIDQLQRSPAYEITWQKREYLLLRHTSRNDTKRSSR
jgi:hypothetical protein